MALGKYTRNEGVGVPSRLGAAWLIQAKAVNEISKKATDRLICLHLCCSERLHLSIKISRGRITRGNNDSFPILYTLCAQFQVFDSVSFRAENVDLTRA
jgi:hypothetical protein